MLDNHLYFMTEWKTEEMALSTSSRNSIADKNLRVVPRDVTIERVHPVFTIYCEQEATSNLLPSAEVHNAGIGAS